ANLAALDRVRLGSGSTSRRRLPVVRQRGHAPTARAASKGRWHRGPDGHPTAHCGRSRAALEGIGQTTAGHGYQPASNPWRNPPADGAWRGSVRLLCRPWLRGAEHDRQRGRDVRLGQAARLFHADRRDVELPYAPQPGGAGAGDAKGEAYSISGRLGALPPRRLVDETRTCAAPSV